LRGEIEYCGCNGAGLADAQCPRGSTKRAGNCRRVKGGYLWQQCTVRAGVWQLISAAE
jgi:hypothetical protein